MNDTIIGAVIGGLTTGVPAAVGVWILYRNQVAKDRKAASELRTSERATDIAADRDEQAVDNQARNDAIDLAFRLIDERKKIHNDEMADVRKDIAALKKSDEQSKVREGKCQQELSELKLQFAVFRARVNPAVSSEADDTPSPGGNRQ